MEENIADLKQLADMLEGRRRDRMLAGDADGMDDLLDPEVHYAHSSGFSDTKESFVKKFRDGLFVYKSIESDLTTLVALGERAFLGHGVVHMEAIVAGHTREFTAMLLVVWRDIGHGWKLVAHQTTLLP
jgi:Domain of unknown function (DUF4440)